MVMSLTPDQYDVIRSYIIGLDKHIEELEKLATQRGARMQIMREWIESIIGFCEAVGDEAHDKLPASSNEHEQGYHRGTGHTCKRVRNYIGELRDSTDFEDWFDADDVPVREARERE